jgi:uncharacterized coiled-coil DUF342 family protein
MSVVTTAIAALSAITAVASLLVYLHFVRRFDLSSAREEALALAETRREVIRELHAQLRGADESRRRERSQCERRVRELQAALDDLRTSLELTPPDVEGALARIRRLLPGERPAA